MISALLVPQNSCSHSRYLTVTYICIQTMSWNARGSLEVPKWSQVNSKERTLYSGSSVVVWKELTCYAALDWHGRYYCKANPRVQRVEKRKACTYSFPKPPSVISDHLPTWSNLAENVCRELAKEDLPTCSGVILSRGDHLDQGQI